MVIASEIEKHWSSVIMYEDRGRARNGETEYVYLSLRSGMEWRLARSSCSELHVEDKNLFVRMFLPDVGVNRRGLLAA